MLSLAYSLTLTEHYILSSLGLVCNGTEFYLGIFLRSIPKEKKLKKLSVPNVCKNSAARRPDNYALKNEEDYYEQLL